MEYKCKVCNKLYSSNHPTNHLIIKNVSIVIKYLVIIIINGGMKKHVKIK